MRLYQATLEDEQGQGDNENGGGDNKTNLSNFETDTLFIRSKGRERERTAPSPALSEVRTIME